MQTVFNQIDIEATIKDFAAKGALFAVNSSGGKDSQALVLLISKLVPMRQIIVIHSEMLGVDWAGTQDHMRATAIQAGVPADRILVTSHAAGWSLLDKARYRKRFPGMSKNRWCTSDLKRDPLDKLVRNYAELHGFKLVIDCEGIRAQESDERAEKNELELYERGSAIASGKRIVWKLRPIKHWSRLDVLRYVRDNGQELHPAYALGMTRLSCPLCIYSSKSDLACAAKHNVELLRQYAAVEREINFTLKTKGKKRLWLDETFDLATGDLKNAAMLAQMPEEKGCRG